MMFNSLESFQSTELLQAIATSHYGFSYQHHDELIAKISNSLASLILAEQPSYGWDLTVVTQLPSPRHDSGVYSAASDRSDESDKPSYPNERDFFNEGKLLFTKSQRCVPPNYICYNCQGRYGTHHITDCPKSSPGDSGYQGFKECLSFFKCPNSGCSHKWFSDISHSQDLQVCNTERCKTRRRKYQVDPETEKTRPYHSFNPLNPTMSAGIIKELKAVMSQKLRWKNQEDKLQQWCEAELHRIKRKYLMRDV